MKSFYALLVVITVAVLPFSMGCYGAPSQADMRRHALHRAKDDDEDSDNDRDAAEVQAPIPAPTNGPIENVAGKPSTTPPPNHTSAAQPPAALPTAGQPDTPPHSPLTPGIPTAIGNGPPEAQLTESQRRQRSIDNMQTIGAALCAQLDQTGLLPPAALYDQANRPLLSWRVALLPQLGYQELYDQFKLDQSWDSTHNRKLLAQIPPLYQSPERFDDTTNYLVPWGSNAAFSGRRAVARKQVEDGLENTVLLLEVDDSLAVPWTQPSEYELPRVSHARGVGQWRSGHFFLLWGDGTVGQVSNTVSVTDWNAMFSIDNGESFYASQITSEPVADVATDTAESIAMPASEDGEVSDATRIADSMADADKSTANSTSIGGDPLPDPTGRLAVQPQKARVPTETERRKAMGTLRDLFQADYEAAKTPEQQRELAEEILDQADSMPADSVGRYAMLELCRKIASQAGGVDTALTAADKTIRDFEVDELAVQAEALIATARLTLHDDDNETVLQTATELSDQAMQREDFMLADQLVEVALAAARRTRNQKQIAEVVVVKGRIDTAENMYKRAADAIDLLNKTADDSHGNFAVGSYYCFIKQRWDDGLPMLAQGSNAGLAKVAKLDFAGPETSAEQIGVADRWWELAESGGQHEQSMRTRAAFWYNLALPSLNPGIERVKAEVRIRQANERYAQ